MNEKGRLRRNETEASFKTLDDYARKRREDTARAESVLLDTREPRVDIDSTNVRLAQIRKTDLIRDAQLFAVLDETYGIKSRFEVLELRRESDEAKVAVLVQGGAEQLVRDIFQVYKENGMRSFTWVTFLSAQVSPEIANADWFLAFGRELDFANEIPDIDTVPESDRLDYQKEMMKRQAMTNMTGYYALNLDTSWMTPRELDRFEYQRDIFNRLQEQGLEPFSIDEMAQLAHDEAREFIDRSDVIKTRLEYFRDNGEDAEYVAPRPPEPETPLNNVLPFRKRER